MSIFKQAAGQSKKEHIRDAMVYNIWLAGLGAYAKSREEVNQISGKGKSLFDELIERGRAVESQTKERVHTARSQTSVAIEERMHSMVQKFIGIDNDRLDRVDDKIDQLTASIEALLARQQEAEAAKPAPRKRAAAKASTKADAPAAKKPSVARRKNVKAAEPVQAAKADGTNVDGAGVKVEEANANAPTNAEVKAAAVQAEKPPVKTDTVSASTSASTETVTKTEVAS
ncbi:phasin-related domain-containing protein [Photobacterium sp. GSS17]|uniref:phasin-related domain-containing protein n=1 Tax=Photobacterium TaxID=657 RepID=UPI00235F6090|nr:phasin family protein [Photobacterium sp. GSS17]